jgi:mRNA interferase RelE/StbE
MQKPDADNSSDFRIFETNAFMDELVALPPQAVLFLRRKLTEYVYPQLRRDPYFGVNIKKLRGYAPATWRYRIGKFRVFFIVDPKEKIVFVLSVDYRRDAYR